MKILITGTTRGIGKAIFDSLNNNNNVLFAAARNEDFLKDFEHYCVCDLSTFEGMKKLGNYIQDNKIDVLINNAGTFTESHISKEINLLELDRTTKLNLEAPLYLISRAIPYMKEQGFGRIVNIGSISGVMGEAYASVYSATKSGLIGATKAIALEVAEFGITINTINPGWVETDLGNESIENGDLTKDEIIDCIPQKRFITPIEIADLVKYLISKEAKGCTGQSINLCAGLSVGY